MRRSPIQRRTPLANATPLHRYTPPAQVSPRRTANAVAAGRRWLSTLKPGRPKPAASLVELRAGVADRSGGWCEMQLNGCLGRATDTAHRITIGMGGVHGEAADNIHRLSDALHACRLCHEWTHHQDDEANDLGLRLKRGCDPLAEPVWYRGVLSFLTDDGRIIDFEDVAP
jgi:hypothetical protein